MVGPVRWLVNGSRGVVGIFKAVTEVSLERPRVPRITARRSIPHLGSLQQSKTDTQAAPILGLRLPCFDRSGSWFC